MAGNLKISQMPSITNSGTLQVPVIDPTNLGVNFRTTVPPVPTSLAVTDGATTVTNTSTIDFTSGAAVSNLGGGIAGVSISGGGGGVTAGLGLYLTDGTIGNTGTIVQAAATGTNAGAAILLKTGGSSGDPLSYSGPFYASTDAVTNPGTSGGSKTGDLYVYTGDVVVTDITGFGNSGAVNIRSGSATYGVNVAIGPQFALTTSYINGTGYGYGGDFAASGGSAPSVTGSKGGSVSFQGGAGNLGGNITFTPGTGATNGVIIGKWPTSDPGVLGAPWQLATAPYTLFVSQG
jgi:hypothetical protein